MVLSVVWSMVQSVVRSARSVGCPVIGDSVGDPVGGLVSGLVSGPVDVAVCDPVHAVCGLVETRPAPYSIRWPAGFRCLDIGRASRGFRSSHGLLLRWCCSVAERLRWCCGGPVDGPVGGPVGGPVNRPVGGPVNRPVGGLVDGPVCGPVRAVCGPSKHVLLHTMACQLQMLGYWSQGLLPL